VNSTTFPLPNVLSQSIILPPATHVPPLGGRVSGTDNRSHLTNQWSTGDDVDDDCDGATGDNDDGSNDKDGEGTAGDDLDDDGDGATGNNVNNDGMMMAMA
jgi:hypothetical protein